LDSHEVGDVFVALRAVLEVAVEVRGFHPVSDPACGSFLDPTQEQPPCLTGAGSRLRIATSKKTTACVTERISIRCGTHPLGRRANSTRQTEIGPDSPSWTPFGPRGVAGR